MKRHPAALDGARDCRRRASRGLLLAVLVGNVACGATLQVGSGAAFTRIADAAQAARDGDVVEIQPGEYRGDVVVWTQKRLTIRGLGAGPVLAADGRIAEGKAIWVFRDGEFDVSNVTFTGARTSDRNGAGIRFERGRLRIRGCRFYDNENGILTGGDPDSELAVEDSEFARAPRDRGPLDHLLYVGRIGRFTLTGSRFHQGFEAHLVKSRARQNFIRYNMLYDGPGGMAAYELEFPNGGLAYVIGNVIGQSAQTTNPVVIAYGAEGPAWPENALYLSHNTLVSQRWQGGRFLRIWSDKVPDARVTAINNLTVGLGLFSLAAPGQFAGNYPTLSFSLADPAALDFRLGALSPLRGIGVVPPTVNGLSLAPTAEFALPVGTRPLAPPANWTPGAFQTIGTRN